MCPDKPYLPIEMDLLRNGVTADQRLFLLITSTKALGNLVDTN